MNNRNNIFLVEEDSFNTQHFDIKMGNIAIKSDLSEVNKDTLVSSLNKTIAYAKEEGYKHLTFKVCTNQKEIIKCAVNQNMLIIDTLVRYVFDFSKSFLPEITHKCDLKDCVNNDIKYLKDIARNSFKIDRFHSDDNFPNELCDLYYDKWIENSCDGLADKVIVAHYNNEVVGFTTGNMRSDEDYSNLVLSAVSSKYRGIGVYTSMIHEGTKWLYEKKSKINKGIVVGTQIENIAVQKAWIKLGYSIFDSQYVFHIFIK